MNVTIKNKVVGLIQKNKIIEAIELLQSQADPLYDNELTLLKARYNQNLENERKGILSSSDINLHQNQIRSDLLNLLNSKKIKIDNLNPLIILKKFWLVILIILGIILFNIFSQKKVIGIQGDNNDNNEIHIED